MRVYLHPGIVLDTELDINFQDEGIVISVGDGIVNVFGLQSCQSGELVTCNGQEGSVQGMALNLEKKLVGVVLFGNDRLVGEGDTVSRSQSIVSIPVGPGYLGRVIDALGNFIDGGPTDVDVKERRSVDVKAPGIIARESVKDPLFTGMYDNIPFRR